MLELKNISVGYERRYYVRNVDLKFEPGMLYTIVGKNGSGKSDLLKTCSGCAVPKTGTVLLDGKELSAYSSNERAQFIAYLPQCIKTSRLSAKQLFEKSRSPFLLRKSKLSQEEQSNFYRAMGDMKVAGFATTPLRELSRGELQRVAIALQLALDTPVVLLDEPLAFMDSDAQHGFMELLSQLKQRGKTVIMTTHNLPLALRYCDQIIVINAGKEIHTGTSDEIQKNGVLNRVFHFDGNTLLQSDVEQKTK